MRLAFQSWALQQEGGFDQVIDLVIFDDDLRLLATQFLPGAFLVGVHCDVEQLVQRELARGDRHIGFASGTSAVVHNEMEYDLNVDSTVTLAAELAKVVFEAFTAWQGSP